MSSIIGFQQKSLIREIEIIEELEKLVEKEKRVTKQKVMDRTANQLQSIYLNYLSNVSPFRQPNTTRRRVDSDPSNYVGPEPITSPAFLLSEPKQLDFNSNERQVIQSLLNADINETPVTSDTTDGILQISYETTCLRMERSTSPMSFQQTKSVQTDVQHFSSENYSQTFNELIDELKSLLKNANQLIIDKNKDTLKVDNKEKNLSTKQTQTSKKSKPIKDTLTQYESKIQSVDAFCQISVTSSDKSNQTDEKSEEKAIKLKLIDIWTQTDPLTDEEKSLNSNSYDMSVGEVPYISDDSSYC